MKVHLNDERNKINEYFRLNIKNNLFDLFTFKEFNK